MTVAVLRPNGWDVTVAVLRPNDWDLPLLVHVAGAMVLVGALTAVAAFLVLARRGDGSVLLRVGLRVLLIGALPGFVLMRVGAEWIRSEEDAPDDATWISLGYAVSDGGLLLLLAATLVAGLALRRRGADAANSGLATACTVLVGVSLAAYVLAIWAMTAKPG